MKKITILFILSLLFGAVRAQEKEYKLLVMGSPQHLAINGLRVDLDLPLKRSWQWLVLSPTFYYNKGDDALGFFYESSYNRLIGGGLDVNTKSFLGRKIHGEGAYASFGGGYRYLNVKTSDFKWVSYEQKGLRYYERQPADYSLDIHSINARAVLGLQTLLMPGMMIDVYAGVGLKYSIHDQPEGTYLKYNESTIDYGYTGTMFIGGFRIGVALE